jgi:hypothetical protein
MSRVTVIDRESVVRLHDGGSSYADEIDLNDDQVNMPDVGDEEVHKKKVLGGL